MKVKDLRVELSFVGKFAPNQIIDILEFDITDILFAINNDINSLTSQIEIDNDSYRLIFKINNHKRTISSIVIRYGVEDVKGVSIDWTFEKKDEKGVVIRPFRLKVKFGKNRINVPTDLVQLFKNEFIKYNISDIKIADSEPQKEFLKFLYNHGISELEKVL